MLVDTLVPTGYIRFAPDGASLLGYFTLASSSNTGPFIGYFVFASFASAFMLKVSHHFYCAPHLVSVSDMPCSFSSYAPNARDSSRPDSTRKSIK